MDKKVVVSFANDSRKEGVKFPDVELGKDEYGNIQFKCTHIELVNFISTNFFHVKETVHFSDGTGRQIDIMHFNTGMGQYWESEEEYEKFKFETRDCY